MCHKIRAFDVSRQLSSSLFRLLPVSWCLREMKLHLDNTVGGGQRAANGPRCVMLWYTRHCTPAVFLFHSARFLFTVHGASHMRDEFFRPWQCVPGYCDRIR